MKILKNLFGIGKDPYPNVPKERVNEFFIKKIGTINKTTKALSFHIPKYPETHNILVIIPNEFKNSVIVQQYSCLNYNTDENWIYADISIAFKFYLENEEVKMLFINIQKEIKPKKGDSVSFLLENGEIIRFEFQNDSLKHSSNTPIELSNLVNVDFESFQKLCTGKIHKIQLEIEKSNSDFLLQISDQYQDKIYYNLKMLQFYMNNELS